MVYPVIRMEDALKQTMFECDDCEDGTYWVQGMTGRCTLCVREWDTKSGLYHPDKTVDVLLKHDLMQGLGDE
jgi:hypothetical protein